MKVLKTELTNCLRRDKMLLCVFSNNTMAEIKNLVKSSLSMTGCAGVMFFTINLYFDDMNTVMRLLFCLNTITNF